MLTRLGAPTNMRLIQTVGLSVAGSFLICTYAAAEISCPAQPQQASKNSAVAVEAAVGKLGPFKAANVTTNVNTTTADLLGKLPQADQVYLQQMLFASFCTAVRDDPTASNKEHLIAEYSKELFGKPPAPPPPRPPESQHPAPPDEIGKTLGTLRGTSFRAQDTTENVKVDGLYDCLRKRTDQSIVKFDSASHGKGLTGFMYRWVQLGAGYVYQTPAKPYTGGTISGTIVDSSKYEESKRQCVALNAVILKTTSTIQILPTSQGLKYREIIVELSPGIDTSSGYSLGHEFGGKAEVLSNGGYLRFDDNKIYSREAE